jgi:hypothetical protein
MNLKRQWCMQQCSEIALWEGLDDALIGVAERPNMPPLAVYDRERILRKLRKDMPYEDAEEYMTHNITCAWIGDLTPITLHRVPPIAVLQMMDVMAPDAANEIERLRNALAQIAENKDEPYARDFAMDILERREPI